MRKSPAPRRSRIVDASGFAGVGLLVIAAVACAETTASAPAPVTTGSAGKAASGPEVAWGTMNKDQRIEYMKLVVLPQMRQVFIGFSPDRFGKMNCMTCHGDSAADGTFKMPNPKLPKLPSTPEGFKKVAADRPAVMEFMMKEVKPKMAALLGQHEYNPETKAGFGCMQCHTTAP